MAGTTVPITLRRAGDDRLGSAVYFLRRNPRMIVGGTIVLAWLFIAAFAPWIAPYDPIKVNVTDSLIPPGPGHWLGTDDLGRDVLSRVMWGARVSLSV
ncbi:MAG TPA: ABC transporter permease, partial [Verrucomicrobiae bacterium]|nr:ABC transporter permease [Verrucomicrobiae bacterium]